MNNLPTPTFLEAQISDIPPGAFKCRKCVNWWTGLSSCHCPTCHANFTSIKAFDKHRRTVSNKRVCIDPEDAGLVPAGRRWGGWMIPTSKDEVEED